MRPGRGAQDSTELLPPGIMPRKATRTITVTRIELISKVGADGVLKIEVPVGPDNADRDVRVTVEPLGQIARSIAVPNERKLPLRSTFGSCAELGLVEPADLPLQGRDW